MTIMIAGLTIQHLFHLARCAFLNPTGDFSLLGGVPPFVGGFMPYSIISLFLRVHMSCLRCLTVTDAIRSKSTQFTVFGLVFNAST